MSDLDDPFDPRRMTARARWYLVIAATRNGLAALTCLAFPQLMVSPAFVQIKAVFGTTQHPLAVWGVLFAVTSAMCIVAIVMQSRTLARLGLICCASTVAVFGAGFLAAALIDLSHGVTPAGSTGVVFAFAIAAKDLVVMANPMRSPFEELARQVLASGTAPERSG